MQRINAQMVLVIGDTVTESTISLFEDRGIAKGVTHGGTDISFLFPEGGLQQIVDSFFESAKEIKTTVPSTTTKQ